MTTATTAAPATKRTTGTTARTRLTALGRAELTLLARNRTAIFVALLMPAAMIMAMKSTFEQVDLKSTGMTVAGAALVGGIGTVLLQAVYMNLVAAYVARREELVLKRLRTGEVTDGEILAGTALPAGALALAQSLVIVFAGTAFFGLGAPERPALLLAGLLLGVVLLTALAAVSSVVTRTVQTAQLTTLPLFLVSMMGSGFFVPLEIFPDRLATFCELLPLTGVMTLIRAGWLGGPGGTEVLGAALAGLVWTAAGVFAVQRWFRWDPRR